MLIPSKWFCIPPYRITAKKISIKPPVPTYLCNIVNNMYIWYFCIGPQVVVGPHISREPDINMCSV